MLTAESLQLLQPRSIQTPFQFDQYRMKISCVIHSLNGGGAERVMAGLSSRLQAKGHAVTLITLDDARCDRHEVDPRVSRRPLDVMRHSRSKFAAIANNFRRVHAVRKAIRDSQPDVVLSFCDATNVLTLLATRGLGFPVVVSERSDPGTQLLAWPWSRLRPMLYRRANDVIVLTQTAADAVAAWCKNPDRKSTRLNSSHGGISRMPSSA